jgi:hypothetical protein
MIERNVRTIYEAFKETATIISEWGNKENPSPYSWFRGVSDTEHKLLPGAYWRTDYDEYGPLVSFSQEGGAFADIGPVNNWETYYLAQHHGIPTRLLDWTESFSAALFFALDGWDGVTSPCIWILNPSALNLAAIGWEGIIAPNNFPEEIGIWLPGQIKSTEHIIKVADEFTYDNRKPLAIYPQKLNRRIVAQQGTFTVHGRDRACLLDYIDKEIPKPDSVIARVVLDGADIDECRRDLAMLGVRRSSIYPDIDNYIKHLKSVYNW